jgi:putative ABC transport system permease protein
MRRHRTIDQELQFHIDERIDDLVRSGLPRGDAERQARVEFGGLVQAKEAIRDQSWLAVVDGFHQDVRLSIRSLRVTPIVTAVAILSLGLGIGANTALFSMVNALMFRALPVVAPDRLAVLSGGITSFPWVPTLQGYNNGTWTAVRDRADEFDGTGAWFPQRLDLSRGGEIHPVDTLFVSGSYFATLGVRAYLGRVIETDDEPVAVLSYAFWRQHFGGLAGVIGQPLVVERVPFIVIGVAPDGFFGSEVGRTFDVALPMRSVVQMGRASVLNAMITRILIRLRPHQSIDAATTRLRALQPEIRRLTMPDAADNAGANTPYALTAATFGTSALRDRYARPMLVVFAVVALVLLVACANIANVMMARATARRHELAVRRALGAPSGRLARLLLVESVLLGACGAVVGFVIAQWSTRLIVDQLSSPFAHIALDVAPDLRMFVFTTIVTAITVLVFGVAPAFWAARVDPIDALRTGGRTVAGDPARRFSATLVVAQVTLSIVVVTVAALLTRSFVSLVHVPIGFDADRVLLVTVSTLHSDVPPARRFAVLSQIVDAIRAIPNVSAAGASTITPVSGVAVVTFVTTSNAPRMADTDGVVATNTITPGWMATYGLSLRAGRDFDAADTSGSQPVALVNETFARGFLRDPRGVGETVTFRDQPPRTVVGIVSDAIYNSAKEPAPPTMYSPLGAFTPPTMTVSVRVGVEHPTDVVPAIRAAITGINRDVAFSFRTLADQVNASIAQDRLVALLSVAFSVLALILAALGIYGVTSYGVATRRPEIGIRLALGAAPFGIMRLAMARITMLITVGLALGAGISAWASTFIRSLLFGVRSHDPLTFAIAAVTLAAVGAAAAAVPAWRAARLDPAYVLREN